MIYKNIVYVDTKFLDCNSNYWSNELIMLLNILFILMLLKMKNVFMKKNQKNIEYKLEYNNKLRILKIVSLK